MKLTACKVGSITYFCNEAQIKEAGCLENAAKALHEAANQKPKKVVQKIEGEKPDEK